MQRKDSPFIALQLSRHCMARSERRAPIHLIYHVPVLANQSDPVTLRVFFRLPLRPVVQSAGRLISRVAPLQKVPAPALDEDSWIRENENAAKKERAPKESRN